MNAQEAFVHMAGQPGACVKSDVGSLFRVINSHGYLTMQGLPPHNKGVWIEASRLQTGRQYTPVSQNEVDQIVNAAKIEWN
jgi:hypothetical protein